MDYKTVNGDDVSIDIRYNQFNQRIVLCINDGRKIDIPLDILETSALICELSGAMVRVMEE